MLSETLQAAYNKQLNREFFSSYLYLSMAAYCEHLGLPGAANWMRVQSEEENFHAMKIFAYINERGGRIELDALEKPQIDWNNLLDVFESVLEHEQLVTKGINTLMNLAMDERDHASIQFLSWFVNEQVEEEASVSDIINKLKITGVEGHALFMIDQILSQRVFTPPVDAAQ